MSTIPSPVVLTGGTGLVGGALLPELVGRGVGVRALVRGHGRLDARAGVEEVAWDGITPPSGALAGAGALVHLSGEPVFGGLPTAARRERLRASRIESTRALVARLAALPEGERPRTFVCASAVGYYGDRGDESLDESAPPGEGLLADLCVDWEAAAAEAERHGVRVCSLRIGVVLSRHGGALPLMARPFRLGLGGRLGSGRQWFPWIHLDDLVAMLLAALADDRWRGPANAVAPNPVRNADLTRALGSALSRPTLLPVPAFAIRAAFGEISAELLGSKRVEPRCALDRGFTFRVPELSDALRAELG
ncbi:MAG TPA: TIGR01777 family oxidoreductase [Myxococcota bacterium]|nr:TIGR01777 family oxidoreductase [Myxococcota bacterium]